MQHGGMTACGRVKIPDRAHAHRAMAVVGHAHSLREGELLSADVGLVDRKEGGAETPSPRSEHALQRPQQARAAASSAGIASN